MSEERVQRRLAAIMAADVVGYSRLMGADEEGTLARLKDCRAEVIDPCLSHYGGRTVKLMGDGVLVEFASAVDAVQSALDIQVAMAERNDGVTDANRMALRVGVNIGDIIVDGDDIHGDGVNIASRLEGLSKAGGICISDDVYRQVRGKIDAAFDDLGPQQVKNIAEPIHAYAVRPALTPVASVALPLPDKPSIAVLPFDNMSGDPEQEYFADGIAEDIITALSRFQWFFVIARNSSFTYKGRAVDVKQVAENLGVQYVLEGSVRKGGNRVRITAQLVDATTGRHIWAERYDRELDDIFAVQDEITEAITAAVAPSFVLAEEKRADRKPPESFDAWDYALRGNQLLWRLTKEEVVEAKRLFQIAIDLDAKSSIALSGLSLACVWEFLFGWIDNPPEALETAYQAAQRAIAADQQDAWAHAMLGFVNLHRREHDAAIGAYRRAIEINPNLAFAEGGLGHAYGWQGNYEEATIHLDKAARLSPHDPARLFWNLGRMAAAFVAGKYEESAHWGKNLTETFPEFALGWRVLATSSAHIDRIDDARVAVKQLLRLAPHDNVQLVGRAIPVSRPEDLERFLDGLRKAGLPESRGN